MRKIDASANFIADLFDHSTLSRSGGFVEHAIYDTLREQTVIELNRPFAKYAELGTLSFCFPDKLIKPTCEKDLIAYWRAGATANIQNLEIYSPYIHEICSLASETLKNRVTCSMYVSGQNAISFDYHTDEWDVVAIQIKGRKQFFFDDDGVISSNLINEGNWLKITNSDLHKAVAETLSVHLSFGRHHKYSYGTIPRHDA